MAMNIKELIALGESALEKNAAADLDGLVEALQAYSLAFDSWQQSMTEEVKENLSEVERDTLRENAKRLSDVHAKLVGLASDSRNTVADELSTLHKRNKALKTYLDRFPSRISVTGRRKG